MAKKKRSLKTSSNAQQTGKDSTEEVVDPSVLASLLSVDYPLIDPSLIHALLLDYEPSTLHRHVDEIRNQLGILEASSVADAADERDTSESRETLLFSNGSSADCATQWDKGSTGPTSSSDFIEDDNMTQSELLASFFPDLPMSKINDALKTQPSSEAAVDYLLSVEMIRNVVRLGTWPGTEGASQEEDAAYEMVRTRSNSSGRSSRSANQSEPKVLSRPTSTIPSRPSSTTPSVPGSKGGKGKKSVTVTIPVVDTLQRRQRTPGSATPSTPGSAAVQTDIWSAFSSLSEYLSDIVPRATSNFFTSYLHSPEYNSVHEAITTALRSLAASSTATPPSEEDLVILRAIYEDPSDDASQAPAELDLCLRAVDGDVSAAIDLMDLLSELSEWPLYNTAYDDSLSLAELDQALAKVAGPAAIEPTPAPATTRVVSLDQITRRAKAVREKAAKGSRVVPGSVPTGPALSSTPFDTPDSLRTAAGSTTRFASSTAFSTLGNGGGDPKGSWATVVPTPRRAGNQHRLAANIPAYARGMLPQDRTPGSLAAAEKRLAGLGPNSSALQIAEYTRLGDAASQRRADAIKAAVASASRGGPKHISRAVAAHHYEQARVAKKDQGEMELARARLAVKSQLEASAGLQVDLHYMTAEQAKTVALEQVNAWWSRVTAANESGTRVTAPFKIVTGKGIHSTGHGVLGPAVARALTAEGWRVEQRDGAVFVRGVKGG